MKVVQLKMREARFWLKMKFEPTFFQVLWQFLETVDQPGKCWRVMVQNAAFSNWRCAFEKIRTDLAQNL
jgi:hypothetical protein